MSEVNKRAAAAIELAKSLAAQFATRADEADLQGRLPSEDVQALRESGYLTISIPEQYGGWGLGLRACVAAHYELAQGSGSSAIVAAMPVHIFGSNAERSLWSADVMARLCHMMADGALMNSIASEPQLGSPSRGAIFQTRAERVAEGWRINGHKNWSTGGEHLTHLLVGVDVEGDPAQILIPNNIAGVRWERTWSDSLSLRASDSNDVYFENVIVPEDHLLQRREPGAGKPPTNAWFPTITATTYLGVAAAAYRATIRFALDRVPTALGKPIASLPGIQRQIGMMKVRLDAARVMLLDAAEAWDGGDHEAAWPQLVAAKVFANDAAIEITDLALRVAGGQAVTRVLPLERYYRDVRGTITHPPSGDLALELVGRAAISAIESADQA